MGYLEWAMIDHSESFRRNDRLGDEFDKMGCAILFFLIFFKKNPPSLCSGDRGEEEEEKKAQGALRHSIPEGETSCCDIPCDTSRVALSFGKRHRFFQQLFFPGEKKGNRNLPMTFLRIGI